MSNAGDLQNDRMGNASNQMMTIFIGVCDQAENERSLDALLDE